jgi:hypothetical protein
MVASGVAKRFDLFILTCLRNVSRRATFGRIPLDVWSARRRDLYLTTYYTTKKHPCPGWDSNPQSQQASGRRPTSYIARPLESAGLQMSNQQAFYSLIIREQCNPLPISAVTAYLVAISSYVSALDPLQKKKNVCHCHHCHRHNRHWDRRIPVISLN